MYFQNFPNIYYQFEIDNELVLKIVKDVTLNVRFRKAILEQITLYDTYDLKEGDTPHVIAHKYYGNAEYHWIVMLCNLKYNWINDFPLGYHAFELMLQDKYANPEGIHHYENADGFIVNASDPLSNPISNRQYEDQVNESKRRIKLISPQLLSKILAEFKSIML